MAQIIPKLNLNKHPSEVINGSLIDATNIIVSNDNAVIQTEPQLDTSDINNQLINLIGNRSYSIKYCISCNKELIIFVLFDDDTDNISLYRYNEDYNETKYVTTTDYHGGELLGTFTYNFNNLIIAFSEYFEDDSKNVPLKTINLGKWNETINDNDVNQLNNSKIHPCNPEIKIPNITTSYVKGNCYKGWYFIFIRYKIDSNTYTQWFNTNEYIFIDTFTNTNLYKSYISSDVKNIGNKKNTWNSFYNYISDDTDISLITLQCDVINKDTKYKYYQLGFVINRKDTTKCYRSEDIDINNSTFIFNNNLVVEEGLINMINTYTNYYNVKSLTTVGNRLYIGNYKENNFEKDIINSLKNINLSVSFVPSENNTDTQDIETRAEQELSCTVYCTNRTNNIQVNLTAKLWNNQQDGMIYYNGNRIPLVNKNHDDVVIHIIGRCKVKYRYQGKNVTETVDAKNIIVAPFESKVINGQPNQGRIFILKDGELIEHEPDGSNINTVSLLNSSHNKVFGEIAMPYTNCDFTHTEVGVEEGEIKSSTDILNTSGLRPNNPYNFFIHFIDKYGLHTDGFNISNFNLNTSEDNFINNIGDKIIITPNDNNSYIAKFILDNIPEQYVGWFISYEKIERYVKYTGFIGDNSEIQEDSKDASIGINKTSYIAEDIKRDSTDPWGRARGNNQNFISNELNFLDSITTDFDIARFYDTTVTRTKGNNNIAKLIYNKTDNTYIDIPIISKHLLVADSYNNIGGETKFQLELDGVTDIIKYSYIVELIKSDKTNVYNNINKTLIPCSEIKYETGEIDVNTKDSFHSEIHVYDYKERTYWNDTLKYFQSAGDSRPVIHPVFCKVQQAFVDIPWESLQINNKPEIIFFPNEGLRTTDEYEKSFIIGTIIEAKNTVDLFQQKNNTIWDACPKTIINYYESKNYSKDYPKTIRRSNIIQDESRNNAWRQFELEQYKNITENKGDVTKLIAIGYYFIVHCQHGMFLFNGTDSIEAKENNIQLSSVDFWDIQYKEIVTSNLGYAGLQKEYSGIVGSFGYIFYDSDRQRFYRYDNGQVAYIDDDINNYIRKLKGYNVHLVDDKRRYRILINFNKDGENDIVISYNYHTNTFVSRHTYNYVRGYSTKENTYMVMKYDSNINGTNINVYKEALYYNAVVNVMLNANYIGMKYIEYILYKVAKVTPVALNNYSPVEGLNDLYAADGVRVYSTHCDTGVLDTTFKDATIEVNKVMNYAKPYWRFGNWHLNALRNRLAEYLQNKYGDDECSRIFGNWFVVEFHINSNEQVELETLDAVYNSAENK